MGAMTMERARAALRLAEDDPGQSVRLGSEVLLQARSELDLAAAAVAGRALGLAALHHQDLDSAVGYLRQAIQDACRADASALAAEARMTLAFALAERGLPQEALHEIDLALAGLEGLPAARARAQRGAIMYHLGRLDEALADYRAAIPTVRDAGDTFWLRRLLLNRGILQVDRQQFTAADADLHEAERLCEELGLDVYVGYAQQNLGYSAARRGDVPRALAYYARAETRLRAHQAQLGSLLTDRAELLLSIRLVAEAREQAEQAIAELRRERRMLVVSEVRLLLAQAALSEGDAEAAAAQAGAAVREFRQQERPAWLAVARLLALAADRAGAAHRPVGLRRAEAVADDVAAAGWVVPALEARLLAADVAVACGASGRAQTQLRLAARGRRRGPAVVRARAWYALGRSRMLEGNTRGASAAVRAGLTVLDEYHAALGASDLRAFASGHRVDLAEAGIRMALASGRADRVLEWAERGRVSHLLHRPLRPPRDPQLAASLAQLRAAASALQDAQRAGSATAQLVQRQQTLERLVRDRVRQQPTAPSGALPARVRLAGLTEGLGDRALVEFVQCDGQFAAVSLVNGRTRFRWLGSVGAVSDLVERLPFAVSRLARRGAGPGGGDAALVLLRDATQRLDRLLFGPLPELAGRELVLVPTGVLQSVPWHVLPSCAGRPLTVSPSATVWHLSNDRADPPPGAVLVAAGPDLPGAAAEAGVVGAIHDVAPLLPPASTAEAVLAGLNGAGLAHVAAHGRIVAQNPLFSDLLLADGPLVVYDLEQLPMAPHTVVLAACDSGRSVVGAGDELLGLAAGLLTHGTTQLIASVLSVPDTASVSFMTILHRGLAAGRPPAVALSEAHQQVAGDPQTMAAAAGYVCLGAGFLPARPVRSTQATGGG